jgi:hypothetical protein
LFGWLDLATSGTGAAATAGLGGKVHEAAWLQGSNRQLPIRQRDGTLRSQVYQSRTPNRIVVPINARQIGFDFRRDEGLAAVLAFGPILEDCSEDRGEIWGEGEGERDLRITIFQTRDATGIRKKVVLTRTVTNTCYWIYCCNSKGTVFLMLKQFL